MSKGLEALQEIKSKPFSWEKLKDSLDIIEKELEVLAIIYRSPFIIDSLVELGKLPHEAKKRYLFGTIPNADVEKVEEFFKNGENLLLAAKR